MRRIAPLALALLAGCASRIPAPAALPAVADDSCRILTWSATARGLPLPATPLALQTELESDHFAGSLLGDWGRVLADFRADGSRVEGDRAWFSGVGLSSRELSGLALALSDPARYVSALGPGWSLAGPDSCRLLLRGDRERLRWIRPEPGRRILSDSLRGWTVDARLAQEEIQPPGSCRGH